MGGGPHKLPGRSIYRDSEALESASLCRIGEREGHALLRTPLPGELAAAVSGNSFIGVAGQELIKVAAEIGVAVVAHAVERRSAASEATKPLRYDMLNPAEPGRVRLQAIDASLIARHAMCCPSGRIKSHPTPSVPLSRFESPCVGGLCHHSICDWTVPQVAP
jgi:hypothetical protein